MIISLHLDYKNVCKGLGIFFSLSPSSLMAGHFSPRLPIYPPILRKCMASAYLVKRNVAYPATAVRSGKKSVVLVKDFKETVRQIRWKYIRVFNRNKSENI